MDSKKIFDLIAEYGPFGARKRVKMPQKEFDQLVEKFHRKHFKKLFADETTFASSRTVIDDKKRHERSDDEQSESSESFESCSCSCGESSDEEGEDEVDGEECVFVCSVQKEKPKKKSGALFCSQCKAEGHTKKTCLKTTSSGVKEEKTTKEKQKKRQKTNKAKQALKTSNASNTLKTLTAKFNGLSKKDKDAFLKLVF